MLSSVSPTDPRHHLASEVSKLINQLDICLELVISTQATIAPDPVVLKKQFAYMNQYGSIESDEEYFANMPKSEQAPWSMIKALSRIRLFTETFYFVAWRLRQIINAKAPHDLPKIGRLKAPSILNVRNHLIEHPEKGAVANFAQNMVITDDGPVLKSAKAQFGGGKSSAASDSLDKGLFLNATEFEQEFRLRISESLS